MIPANIKLTKDLVLEPSLALLLTPLALSTPNWDFMPVITGYYDTRNEACVERDAHGNFVLPPPSTKFLCCVKVKQGDQTLGHLRVESTSKGPRTIDGLAPLYITKSWRIKKSRGTHDESETTKLNIALRNAKKYFKPRTTKELFSKKTRELRSSFESATSSVAYGFHRIDNDLSADLQLYAYCFMTNRDIPLQVKANVEKIMLTPSYEKEVGDYQLATEMLELDKAKRLMCIIKTRDDKYLYANTGTDEPIIAEYEQLPMPWQEKLAVLQLLQDHELARDIGFRYTGYSFMIIT